MARLPDPLPHAVGSPLHRPHHPHHEVVLFGLGPLLLGRGGNLTRAITDDHARAGAKDIKDQDLEVDGSERFEMNIFGEIKWRSVR